MSIAKDPKVIMNEQQFVERLSILRSQKTFYKNKFPYNLGLIAPTKKVKTFKDCGGTNRSNLNPYEVQAKSFDCVNLVKAILNGYDVNSSTIGYYQRNLSNTGDCMEAELLAQCTDVSSNFAELGVHPEILYMKGHIGTYIGKVIAGKYNVIECTGSFGGGVVYSWIDADGTRRNQKGGYTAKKWTHHGRPSRWVSECIEEPKNPDPKKDDKIIAQEIIDGKWGNGEDRKNRLKAAGYTDEDIKRIQALVNEMCKNPSKPAENQEVWHTVKTGEVLSVIANRYGVTVDSIMKLNPSIKNPNIIYTGQKIRIK